MDYNGINGPACTSTGFFIASLSSINLPAQSTATWALKSAGTLAGASLGFSYAENESFLFNFAYYNGAYFVSRLSSSTGTVQWSMTLT